MSPGAAGTGHNRHLADPEPRAEAGDELREALAQVVAARLGWHGIVVRGEPAHDVADTLLAGALAPLLAKLQAVEALTAHWERSVDPHLRTAGRHYRRALDL